MIAFDPVEACHARAIAAGIEIASMEDVMREADVVVASTGLPNLIAINLEMKLAAAHALAELAPEGELVPNALDQHVHDAVAARRSGGRGAQRRGSSRSRGRGALNGSRKQSTG